MKLKQLYRKKIALHLQTEGKTWVWLAGNSLYLENVFKKNTFFKIQYWQIKGGVASVSEAKAIQSQLSMIRISTFESIWPALFIIPLLLFDIHIMKWCLGIRNVIFWFLCTLRSFIITEDPVLKPLSVVLLMQECSPALDMLQLMLHYKQLGLISD